MYLTLLPVWSIREPSPEEVRITNTLYDLFQWVITQRRSLIHQVRAVKMKRGKEKIATFMGNVIDELFKNEVLKAKRRGTLPKSLVVTRKGFKGPDLRWERVAWDITTAEQSEAHLRRDVYDDPYRWDLYFVLGY